MMKNLNKILSQSLDKQGKELVHSLLKDSTIKSIKLASERILLNNLNSFSLSLYEGKLSSFEVIENNIDEINSLISLTIFSPDLPFLVESAINYVKSKNAEIIFSSHKRVSSYLTNTPNLAPPGREATIIYIVLKNNTQDSQLQLRTELIEILDCLHLSFQDWKSMESKMKETCQSLDSKNHKTESELNLLLKWLTDNNFIFLGLYETEIESNIHIPNIHSFKGICKSPLYEISSYSNQQSKDIPILNISKWNKPSVIHRTAHMDWIIINHLDEMGNLIKTTNFLGFFTSSVYYQSTLSIPFIRQKVSNVIERYPEPQHSYNCKEVISAIEAFSRGDLLQMTEDEIYTMATEMSSLTLAPKVRLFAKQDTFKSFVNFIVFIPKNRFHANTIEIVEHLLCDTFNGFVSKQHTRIHQDILARIQITLKIDPKPISKTAIHKAEQAIDHATISWEESLSSLIERKTGGTKCDELNLKFQDAFDIRYKSTFSPKQAVHDISLIQRTLEQKTIQFSCYISPHLKGIPTLQLKIYSPYNEPTLSSTLPKLENLGLYATDMVSYETSIKEGNTKTPVFIQHFNLNPSCSLESISQNTLSNIIEALVEIWNNRIDNDKFNNLIIESNLTYRQALIFRAYNSYLKQINFSLSTAYIINTLLNYSNIPADLFRLFELKFDPDKQYDRNILEAIENSIEKAIQGVENSSQEKVISSLYSLIKATKRTNFYQTNEYGKPKDYISLKISSPELSFLPLPKPYVEIFVYSIRFRGIHLRGGKISRGGIRWSDRSEDMRTEILGLMKAQMTKNSVIVPVGSKGGFVLKQITPEQGQDIYLKEGIECYKIFLSGLLDITDNIVNESIVTPDRVIKLDGDDPYLVVAADKGTATFSDTANYIAKKYNFWLDDAFASGGSAGYDHKKLGITARGAWVSVMNHFSDLNIDIHTNAFNVVGIGDMSGDVFGNGMLLSKNIKLIAAFNHKHIFIDPNPHPQISFLERERLFQTPRSQWSDYDQKLISQGGGVFLRSSKHIELSREAMLALAVDSALLTPDELISYILKAPVDLLWNGGIGTYIKSQSETNEMVGDKTNDSVRINGADLRCKIVGEGGNLGMTQLGRIEYARIGGKLNTDFIDNSAGVDCSDHEVNIKILLNDSVKCRKISLEQRNILLEKMSDEVSNLVLQDNKQQALLISIEAHLGNKRLQEHAWLINHLSSAGILNTKIEALPNQSSLSVMLTNKQSLTRPEIAVLMSYAKNSMLHEVLEIDFLDKKIQKPNKSEKYRTKYFLNILCNYFPSELRNDFLTEISRHKLGNEIIATMLSNAFINMLGCTLFHQLRDTGESPMRILTAFLIAKEIFNLDDLWNNITTSMEPEICHKKLEILSELRNIASNNIEWLLHNHDSLHDINKISKSYKQHIEHISSLLPNQDGQNHPILSSMNSLKNSRSMLDIVSIKNNSSNSIPDIIDLYYSIGERMSFIWMKEQAALSDPENYIDKMALKNLINELANVHIQLTLQQLSYISDQGNTQCSVPYTSKIASYNSFINNLKSYTGENLLSMLIIALQHAKSFLKDEKNIPSSILNEVA